MATYALMWADQVCFYLIEVMQGDPYSLIGQNRFIRQVIAPYHDLHAYLHRPSV